ncbi:hypothetical protein GGR57DRAFT_201642 [Xylariaceae sp. FL1272]|nr:hypothetical protein GGR57DRAFT_201642 [Xylariaceae sp. FL1272]
MISCTALRHSSARNRLAPGIWKQFTRSIQTKPRRRNNAAPQLSEEPVGDEPFSVDSESKSVTTAVGDLPLSPLMDPSYWEATEKHKRPKSKARTSGKSINSVSRQFRVNPYALALATPIRYNTATRLPLPNYFLQDFNLINNPQTNAPWWVPYSLARGQTLDSQDDTSDAELDKIEEAILADEQAEMESNIEPTEVDSEFKQPGTAEEITSGDEQAKLQADISGDGEVNSPVNNKTDKVQPGQPHPGQMRGPKAYVLSRQALVSAIGKKNSGYGNLQSNLFGPSDTSYKKFGSRAVWREDMDDFIISHMRHGIAKDLAYLSKLCIEQERYYIVKCFGWNDVKFKRRGALIWFGDIGPEDSPKGAGKPPSQFASHDMDTDPPATVAVHNMRFLLGDDLAKKVQDESPVLKHGNLFMLNGRRTNDLLLRLWKLQGYLSPQGFDDIITPYRESTKNPRYIASF